MPSSMSSHVTAHPRRHSSSMGVTRRALAVRASRPVYSLGSLGSLGSFGVIRTSRIITLGSGGVFPFVGVGGPSRLVICRSSGKGDSRDKTTDSDSSGGGGEEEEKNDSKVFSDDTPTPMDDGSLGLLASLAARRRDMMSKRRARWLAGRMEHSVALAPGDWIRRIDVDVSEGEAFLCAGTAHGALLVTNFETGRVVGFAPPGSHVREQRTDTIWRILGEHDPRAAVSAFLLKPKAEFALCALLMTHSHTPNTKKIK